MFIYDHTVLELMFKFALKNLFQAKPILKLNTRSRQRFNRSDQEYFPWSVLICDVIVRALKNSRADYQNCTHLTLPQPRFLFWYNFIGKWWAQLFMWMHELSSVKIFLIIFAIIIFKNIRLQNKINFPNES